jgi:hypothetical protein
MATAEDVAASVVFLASDDASFISGTAFMIDGGAMAGIPIQRGPATRGYLTLRAGVRRLMGKSTPRPF